MLISILSIMFLFCSALSAGPLWAYHATVKIYVYNDDYEDHDVDVEYAIDGDSSNEFTDLASGDYHEYKFSATAWFADEHTDSFDVYVDGDDHDCKCSTSIEVKTEFELDVELKECEATAPQTDACTVTVDKSGTTCKVTLTINE